MIKKSFYILVSVLFVFTGCQSKSDCYSHSLYEIGLDLGTTYNELALAEFPIYGFIELSQGDVGITFSTTSSGPSGKGWFTQIYLKVEDRDLLDCGWFNFPIMELRAYAKEDVIKNRVVKLGKENTSFRMKELKPYYLFETEEYVIYDLMCFGYDESERMDELITEYRMSMKYSENYNPNRDTEAIVEIIPQVRQWLIEQIQADHPTK